MKVKRDEVEEGGTEVERRERKVRERWRERETEYENTQGAPLPDLDGAGYTHIHLISIRSACMKYTREKMETKLIYRMTLINPCRTGGRRSPDS